MWPNNLAAYLLSFSPQLNPSAVDIINLRKIHNIDSKLAAVTPRVENNKTIKNINLINKLLMVIPR